MIAVLHLGSLDYHTAFELQKSLVALRQQKRISDVLLLLEHSPVITLGRNASEKNLLVSSTLLEQRGVELYESNRGGDITFHGPGQLVGYPIFDLRGFSPRIGAVEFVRRIEEVLIRTCGDLGIPCGRICGLTGVWTHVDDMDDVDSCSSPGKAFGADPEKDTKKIAAIGVHISRGVTSHGFALNVTTDLDYFKLIVPCGISDRPVTSIEQEIRDRPVPSMEQVAHSVSLYFGRVFERQMLWLDSLDRLLETQDNGTTIGVPLQVPHDVQELRRQQNAPALTGPDDVFRA
ncbi:MAG TPA: lipoyl(octanoyl) transferase LipB [Terriglobales bacterium]|nr:lipoyl(octanoyl) transferase LipB [Terriglobales bacterium]